MKKRGNFIPLLALIGVALPHLSATPSPLTPHEGHALHEGDTLAQYTVSSIADAFKTRYFADETNLSNAERDFALSVPSVGFIRTTEKNITTCRYNYVDGKSSFTKFERVAATDDTILPHANLRPVATEDYVLTFDANTHCKNKAQNGRKGLGEFVARRLRAITNPHDMKSSTFVEFYQHCIPTWLQAESADQVTEFVSHLEQDLTLHMIDPAAIDTAVRPVLVLTIQDDLFLQSIDDQTWTQLHQLFNVTTFRDTKIRTLFLTMKNQLVEAREIKGHDTNSSLMAGIFNDIADESANFSTNGMIRKTIKETMKKIVGIWNSGCCGYSHYVRHL